MNKDLQNKELRNRQWVILSILLLFCSLYISESFAAVLETPAPASEEGMQAIRVRIFTLRNINTQRAKEYLQSAKIGDTILAIPGTNAISVTAGSEELVYAATVIKLVDVNEKFDVRFIDVPPGKEAPTDEIELELGRDYSIGTLMEGPESSNPIKAIVVPYKDKLLIVAPQAESDKITEAVKKVLSGKPKTEPNQAEPNLPNSTQVPALPNSVILTREPIVIEANAVQAVSSEPNQTSKKAEEDDMLNGYINELSKSTNNEKAKAEREAAIAKAAAEEAAKAEAEKKQLAQKIAAKPIETEAGPETQANPEPNVIEEEKQTEKKIAQAAKIKKKLTGASQTTVKEPQQKYAGEELPSEVNDIVDVPTEQKVIPELDIPNGEELLELNLPEKLDLVALIDLVGKYLNLNYLYDETKVTGSVTIKVQGKLRVRELYNLLESVLKFRGFAMSRKGRLVTIVPTAEALDQDPTFVERMKAGDVITTSVFHLKYISTATAKKLLGEMKLGSNITELPETGTLVITEYAFRMQRIEDLLSLVDMPGPPREFKLRVLNYTIAEVLVPKIQALAEQLGTVDVTVGSSVTAAPAAGASPRQIRRPQPVVQPQPQQQPGTEAVKKTGVFLDFDKRTNRVLIIGLSNEIKAVEQIIDTLDVPQQDLRVIREYEIQYVDIDKVVQALGELGIIQVSGTPTSTIGTQTIIKAGPEPQQPQAPVQAAIGTTGEGIVSLDQPQVVKLESTNSLLVNATLEQQLQIARIISYIDREAVEAAIPYRIYRLENQEPEALAEVLNNLIQKTVQDKEGKIQQTIKYTEENIAIVPDKNTFSLIVYASKKNQEWIGNMIKTLDKRRPQVLIDVSLVEITRDDKFQYDLDVVANMTEVVSNSIGVKPSQIFVTPPSGSPSDIRLEGGFFTGTASGEGVAKGFFNTGRIQALLDLIDRNGYGRILARPKVLVNDNEKGLISTENTNYIAQITTTALPGQTQTDTTQSSVTFNPYIAKIQLEITPQISEGDLLRLEIKMERNDFQGTGQTVNLGGGVSTTGPPGEKKSSVDTIVTVPDGSTIILGGLTKLDQDKNTNKIPILGDLPIAGVLFRNAYKAATDSKLYIFVKANILRPEKAEGLQQLKDISTKNKIEFEKAEAQFQNKVLLPGIKEIPMEPNQVLDQD